MTSDLRKPGTLLATKNKNRPDNFQTPSWPVKSLLDIINPVIGSVVWDPCCGKGNIVNSVKELGYPAFGTDLDKGQDFLSDLYWNLRFEYPIGYTTDWNMIITNPPYSIKDQFIERCYAHGKPWAMLMPLTALEGKKRLALYRQHGLQLILLPRRVNFETPSGKGSGSHFATAWFTWGFNLPKDITYT